MLGTRTGQESSPQGQRKTPIRIVRKRIPHLSGTSAEAPGFQAMDGGAPGNHLGAPAPGIVTGASQSSGRYPIFASDNSKSIPGGPLHAAAQRVSQLTLTKSGGSVPDLPRNHLKYPLPEGCGLRDLLIFPIIPEFLDAISSFNRPS